MKLRKNKIRRESNSKVTAVSKILNFPKQSRVKVAVKKGKFTSNSITLRETALNNKILRIHLQREDLIDLKEKPRYFLKEFSKSLQVSLIPFKKTTLKSQNLLNKSSKSKHNNPEIKISSKKQKADKMVVNNGKVIKHDPDDYILKRLKAKNSKIFYLKPVPYRSASEGKLNYKFHQLVNDVKNMQLPTQMWKIKVIIRHNKIAAIIFTNKAELERSVSFNSDDDKYHICIDNKPALLVGSPGKVDNCNDIELLLSIMETIDKDSPMITYK